MILGACCLCITLLTMATRSSPSQIRRAAGGKGSAKLLRAVDGWTCHELDIMASQDGKSALHMAAWQGCLANVELLLEKGCDVNVIATGTFSYGKTPIFFAATRCRDDVVQYILQHSDANVKIVNNKGQTLLSIASSHLRHDTIEMIQRAELAQQDEDWCNYRQSHSDGLEYGDLDPRFMERPLRYTDAVHTLAINPTTRLSRRGNFARNNPHVAKEVERKQSKQRTQGRCKAKPPELSREQMEQRIQLWKSISSDLIRKDDGRIGELLLCVVRFEEGLRRPWIPDAAENLRRCLDEDGDGTTIERLVDNLKAFAKEESSCTRREAVLLQKWMQQVSKEPIDIDLKESMPRRVQSKQRVAPIHTTPRIDLSSPPWSKACRAVSDLPHSLLKNQLRHEYHLTLPDLPEFIDDEHDLDSLFRKLRNYADESCAPCVVALDTEWYTANGGGAHLSTIQLSTISQQSFLLTWVVDLLPATPQSTYRDLIRAMLVWLFDKGSNVILLGFAFAHDVSKLHAFCESLSASRCLDIQRLAAQEMERSHKRLPGLQACAKHYICADSLYSLSKTEQCSNWAQRPLRESQLDYAGLDAAVLLVLLGEIAKATRLASKEKDCHNCYTPKEISS